MEFRTKINIPKTELSLSYNNHILMMGSCFIENIGQILVDHRISAYLNPFGVLYNPLSIAQGLDILIDNKKFTEEDLFEHKGLYHSFHHHSNFSHTDKTSCLENINKEINLAADFLKKTDTLFITFGTAYIYQWAKNNMIVGNCHKLPASEFNRSMLSTENIIDRWIKLTEKLKAINPSLQILFTVSPIRHLRDGAHDNQLSKATLLIAIDKLISSVNDTHYFPSYEIMLDDLRDYRFYNEDMIHPNTTAIKYIWDIFKNTYFPPKDRQIMDEWQKINQAIKHRPINKESEEHKSFLRQTLLKLKAFKNKYSYICLGNDIKDLESRL
ncbi:GSCFA domain-containing protein [Dysgonomonas sp. 511]|uniref:GSCFA domain-containing protein n=1 Tax=Dysgonomonas sp. 511 TaxID=2302930 RepID=UPI0013D1DA71|nr:GSCFA domain-containing protein [Dysgonomonas sp. 511]NDV79875.1 GSCFA domain protein [Dysgonomonas sp. 511]